jgi:predicted site-specific integrase-resolvase
MNLKRKLKTGHTHPCVLVRTEHIALALGVSRTTVRRMIRSGALPLTGNPMRDVLVLADYVRTYRARKELEPLN